MREIIEYNKNVFNWLLVAFICFSVDIFITIVVILSTNGTETNPLINWISPMWLLVLTITCANLIAGLICTYIIIRYQYWVALHQLNLMYIIWVIIGFDFVTGIVIPLHKFSLYLAGMW